MAVDSLAELQSARPGIPSDSADAREANEITGSVLADPLLQPLFGKGVTPTVDHPTAFTDESFGGPDRFTRELGGFQHLIAVHRHLDITEEQRQRFVKLYMAPLDDVGMPDDA